MTLALYGKSNRRRGTLLLAALLAVTLAILGGVILNNSGSAAAGKPDDPQPDPTPISGDGITPVYHAHEPSYNPTCSDLGFVGNELKVDPNGDGVYTDGDGPLSVTISATTDDDTFTWSSNIGVDAVWVKGGSGGHNLYDYTPAEDNGDTRLGVPNAANNGISHITFCYDVETTPSATSVTVYKVAKTGSQPLDSTVFNGELVPVVSGTNIPWTGNTTGNLDGNSPYNVPAGAYTVTETVSNGWTFEGYKLAGSTTQCTGDPAGYAMTAVSPHVQEPVICVLNYKAPNINVTVYKVAQSGGAPLGAADSFSGQLDPEAAGSNIAWGPNTGADPDGIGVISIPSGAYTLTETPANGWVFVGYKLAASTTACDANTAGYAKTAVTPTAQAPVICVLNHKQAIVVGPPNLTVAKTAMQNGAPVDQVLVGTAFNWVVTITNSGGSNAVFTNGQDLLHDTPPLGSYGTISAVVGNGTTGTVNCGWFLVYYCEASGTVTIPPGGTVTVTLTVPGGFTLPGDKTNTCLVDPSNNGGLFQPKVDAVDESNEGDNICSDTVTVLLQQNVSFSKYICPSYGAVPANLGTGNDHTGKPDQLPVGKTLGAVNDGNPASAAQFAGCTLSNTGWEFELYTLYPGIADTNGMPFYSRTVNAGTTVTLNGTETVAALLGQLWVREKYQPGTGHGFGVLKCYTDQENKDNLEYIDIDQPGTANVACFAANVATPPTRTVEVCKVVEQNNDGNPDGGNFGGDILYPGGSDSGFDWGVTDVTEDSGAVCDDITIPASGPWKLSEAATSMDDAAGYPMYSTNDGTAVPLAVDGKTGELGDTVTKVTFFNKAVPANNDVTIRKVVTNITGDTTPFTITPPVPLEPKPVTELPGGHHVFTVTAQAGQQFTEIVPAGYRGLGYTILTSTSQLCPDQPVVTDTTGNIAATVDAAGIADPVICFYNEAMGSVQLVKTSNVPSGAQTWNFESTLPELDTSINLTVGAGETKTGQTASFLVPAGSYSVFELNGLRQAQECVDGAQLTDYYTNAQVSIDGVPQGPEAEVGGSTVNFAVVGGKTTIIRFENASCDTVLSAPDIWVHKYNDPAGDFTGTTGLAGWTITITQVGGSGYTDTEVTDGSGLAAFPGLEPGTYIITETPQAGYNVIGSKVDGATPEGGASRTVAVGLDEDRFVDFYNQELVEIEVYKEVWTPATGNNPGVGWQFTLTGCGVTPVTATTGSDGWATFSGLTPAVSCAYTITETQQLGWVAVPDGVETAAPLTGTARVYFRNEAIVERPPQVLETPTASVTQPVTVTTTPTITPTPPTPTTTTPTASATDPVVVTETPELTATSGAGPSETAGARTPQPPITGSGSGPLSGRGMSSIWLAVAGVMAIAAGLGMLSLNKRRS